MSTKDRLVAALVEAEAPYVMIERARAGGYDDFESDHPTPITLLVQHTRAQGLEDIARRAMDGEFDSTPEEAAAWAASPEGQAALAELPWRRS